MVCSSAVPLALMMVRVVVPGVGGPWALLSLCGCCSWLVARWVVLLAFVRQSCWHPW